MYLYTFLGGLGRCSVYPSYCDTRHLSILVFYHYCPSFLSLPLSAICIVVHTTNLNTYLLSASIFSLLCLFLFLPPPFPLTSTLLPAFSPFRSLLKLPNTYPLFFIYLTMIVFFLSASSSYFPFSLLLSLYLCLYIFLSVCLSFHLSLSRFPPLFLQSLALSSIPPFHRITAISFSLPRRHFRIRNLVQDKVK